MWADVRRLPLLVAVVALAAAGRAGAQSIADLPIGARVRFTLPRRDTLGAAYSEDANPHRLRVSTDDGDVRRDAIGFAALGAALGSLLGALQPYEHWRAAR